MLRTNLTIAAMLLSSLASAQTQSTAAAPTDPAAPALVSTVAADSNDSPLVQAAKRAVAARQRTVAVKIDNRNVRNATKLMTTTDTARTIPVFPPLPTPQQQRPAQASADRAAAQKAMERSKREVRRPVDDAEGLYPEGLAELPEDPAKQKEVKPQPTKPRP